jgi:YbbR domain-containing protein
MIRTAGPKVLAVMIALVIWMIASEERREDILERNFQVPLALVGVPSNMVISGEVEDTIAVRLRGPASQVRSLSSDTLEVTVDLADSRPGTLSIPLQPSALSIPTSVEVVSMQPARLRLQLELRKQKPVRISPYLVGAPASGYTIENVETQPGNAVIAGPASLVDEVTEIPTERIILTGRSASFREEVAVISDYPLVRVVEPAIAQVLITINPITPIEPEPVEPRDD